MAYAINVAISLPLWTCAGFALVVGFGGTFNPDTKGRDAQFALLCLPLASGCLYAACWLCQFI